MVTKITIPCCGQCKTACHQTRRHTNELFLACTHPAVFNLYFLVKQSTASTASISRRAPVVTVLRGTRGKSTWYMQAVCVCILSNTQAHKRNAAKYLRNHNNPATAIYSRRPAEQTAKQSFPNSSTPVGLTMVEIRIMQLSCLIKYAGNSQRNTAEEHTYVQNN